jgi:predicted phosphate transport protein (TIGR00153 family)
MARVNKEDKYYTAFIEMSGYSCEAAQFLREILGRFDPDDLDIRNEKMHAIEHSGDLARHAMTKHLAREFITPIEREDIMQLAEAIDTVTDKIEDVLQRIYMFHIREIREEAILLADIIVKCTSELKAALEEFHNFRKSKTIMEKLIEINHLEEEGDRVYVSAVRRVFSGDDVSAKTAVAWSQVFHYMEGVCDACEDVADIIEGVIMKNS